MRKKGFFSIFLMILAVLMVQATGIHAISKVRPAVVHGSILDATIPEIIPAVVPETVSFQIERGVSVPLLEYSNNINPVQNDDIGTLTGILTLHNDYSQSWRCCNAIDIAKAYPVPEYNIKPSQANNYRAREKV